MEAGQYGLTRVTCFLACRLEFDAVAGLLWLSWCVLGGVDFCFVLFFGFFFFERTRPAASMRSPLASFTSLLVEYIACTVLGMKLNRYGFPTHFFHTLHYY